MGYLVSEKEFYIGKEDTSSYSLFGKRTGFGLSDDYSCFFDYKKEEKMSDFLEKFDRFVRSNDEQD